MSPQELSQELINPFKGITEVGVNLNSDPAAVTEALQSGAYVVEVVATKDKPLATVRIGSCQDVVAVPYQGKEIYTAQELPIDGLEDFVPDPVRTTIHPTADWLHFTSVVGSNGSIVEGAGDYLSAGTFSGKPAQLSADGSLVLASTAVSTVWDGPGKARPLHNTDIRFGSEVSAGNSRGHDLLHTTQIVSAEGLTPLLEGIADTMGLEGAARNEFLFEMKGRARGLSLEVEKRKAAASDVGEIATASAALILGEYHVSPNGYGLNGNNGNSEQSVNVIKRWIIKSLLRVKL